GASHTIPSDNVRHDGDVDIDGMISSVVDEGGDNSQRGRQAEISEIGKSRARVFDQRERAGFKIQSRKADNHIRTRRGKTPAQVDGRESRIRGERAVADAVRGVVQ